MFTGIVQALGSIATWDGEHLLLEPGALDVDRLELGESIAVNGCCLTVVSFENGLLSFDLSPETVARTTFSALVAGSIVNIERAMRPNDRLGGHIVQGHVDGVGEIVEIASEGNATIIRFRVPDGTLLIEKGSITLDGISLTIAGLSDNVFNVWVIPHTLENTNLKSSIIGTRVNVEYDLVAKYVKKLHLPYQTV